MPSAKEDEEKSEQCLEFQIVFPNARFDKKSLLLEEKVSRSDGCGVGISTNIPIGGVVRTAITATDRSGTLPPAA